MRLKTGTTRAKSVQCPEPLAIRSEAADQCRWAGCGHAAMPLAPLCREHLAYTTAVLEQALRNAPLRPANDR